MISDHVRVLVADCRRELGGQPVADRLGPIEQRLDEPMRVAVVGRVKAGKSTLLNSLIEERLAPTDHGECTRLVTWYRDGTTFTVAGEHRDGTSFDLRRQRDGNRLVLDLGGRDPETIERLVVTRPNSTLGRMTLIDTPGLGSTSNWGARTSEALTGSAESATADAVIYLMRHLHEDDVNFLEAFQQVAGANADPANSIAVLSRADEIGGADDPFLKAAGEIATRMEADPRIHPMVHRVVPVVGLLAETAATMTEFEFIALERIARIGAADTTAMCLTVDRFMRLFPDLEVPQAERRSLLDRFGLFGLRLSLLTIQRRQAPDSGRLRNRLMTASRIGEVRELIEQVFEGRAAVLQSRTALLALRELLTDDDATRGHHSTVSLLGRVERLLETPEFEELALLSDVRTLEAESTDARRLGDLHGLYRLLGGEGCAPHQRLGLMPDAGESTLRRAAADRLLEVRKRRHDPRTRGALRRVYDGAIAACEAMTTGPGR